MLLGTKEVARVLRVSERTVIRLFEAGEIRAFQVGEQIGGKLWRTRPEIVEHYLRSRLGEIPKSIEKAA